MIIDVHKLGTEERQFDRPLRLPDLPLDGGDAVGVSELRIRGSATRGPKGIDLRGHLSGRLRLQCSRCLESYESGMEHGFRLILVPDGSEFGQSDQNLDPEQALIYYTDEGRADLCQIAREQIYLFLPLKPVCAPNCAGLCPTCGSNRNRIQCGCRSVEVDPRLAPLLEFKKRLGDH